MGKNGGKSQDEFIELGGWEIKKVKDGLDETQVTSLINELISQRGQLTQRTEHLTSLTNLAEKTVTEADKLAEEMKVQAIEQAKNETASLIVEAEVKAQQIENETKKIQLELKSSVQGIIDQLLSGFDSLKQQVEALQAESEQKLSPSLGINRSVSEPSDETSASAQEAIPAMSQTDTGESTEPAPIASDQETTPDSDNLDLELEILPPLDIMKIMEIVTYLDNLPEIENTELIPNTERPSIIVTLREPIDLISMLRMLPEVANIEEDKTEPASEGKPRKIQIRLSVESVAQEVQKG
ncbi:hypothetical protein ACFLWM_02035 [Chloroflexota bacterium]